MAHDEQQIIPRELIAFGIVLETQRGKAAEMAEMLRFAELAENGGASRLLERVVYNNQGVCSFRYRRGCHPHVSNQSGFDILNTINSIAEKSLSCYRLYGCTVEKTKQRGEKGLTLLGMFWNAFFHLDQLEAFGVNHSGKGRTDIVAINFPYLMQVVAKHGVDLPPLAQVRAELKRQDVQSKNVWSAVTKAYCVANPTNSKRMPRVFKCWVIHHPLRNEQYDAMFSLL